MRQNFHSFVYSFIFLLREHLEMKKYSHIILASLLIFSFTACEGDRMTDTGTGALTGTALGAGLGAIIGSTTGHAGAGVAIGAASGLLAGGLIGNESEKSKRRAAEQDERMRRQDEEIRRQNHEIQELKRKEGISDNYYRENDSYRY